MSEDPDLLFMVRKFYLSSMQTACCRHIAVCGQSLLKNHGENEKICVGAHPTGAAAAAAATTIQLYPQSAAMPNGKGRLPIHIVFLHNSPSWTLVLDLAPSTLEKKDTTLGLLPFQTVIASLSSSDKRKLISSLTALQDIELFKDEKGNSAQELEYLTTGYRLLHIDPHLMLGPSKSFFTRPTGYQTGTRKTMLRLRVQELEQLVVQMQLLTKAKEGNALKKCKTFNVE